VPDLPLPDLVRERVASRLDASGVSLGRVVLIAVAVLVAAVFGFRFMATPAAAPEASLPMASTTARGSRPHDAGAASADRSTTTAAEVVVDAAGAVVKPGLYRLPADSRVADLIQAAGGFAADADGDRVNLAAPLTDGEEVYVPHIGEPGPPRGGGTAPGDAGGTAGTAPSQDHPLDLNTATLDQLDLLPGIGPTTAQAILDYRDEHGAFHSVDDLLDVRGIGDAKLADIRLLVRV
jgi:competence protein ComEA